MQSVEVALGERSYQIVVDAALLSDAPRLAELLRPAISGSQVVIVTNPTVQALYADMLMQALPDYSIETFLMSDGEAYKSLETYAAAMDFLMQKRCNRDVCLIALGGGVVGDLTGFVAATYQRGVDFIQVPTTLLAQVDSSVGGKTAVNHPAGKNMIGAFYQPNLVVVDTASLASLPQREYAAGLAEVVKYGVIADANFFEWLQDNVDGLVTRDANALAYAIRRSCEIKADVVAQDEREGGLRAILNYGHTFGHAIENLAGYGTWLHGEAVAIGMVMAAQFSQRLGRIDEATVSQVAQLITRLGLPIGLGANEIGSAAGTSAKLDRKRPDVEAIKQSMGMDKKALAGRVRFVVMNEIGSVSLIDEYSETSLDDVLAGCA